MYQSKLIILFLLCSSSLFGQDHEAIKDQLENREYTERPAVLIYLIDQEESKLPSPMVDQLNDCLKGAIAKSHKFGEQKYHDPSTSAMYAAYRHSVHYVIQLNIIDVMADGKEFEKYAPRGEHEYTITANFVLLDLVKGTRLISEPIIFSDQANGEYDNEFLSSMSTYYRERILAQLQKTFPTILKIKKLGEVNKGKAKSIIFSKADYARSGKPKYLGVYILDKTIAVENQEDIYTFKKIGFLKDLKKIEGYECHYNVEKGKADIYDHFSNGTELYITTLSLGQ